MPTVLVYTQKLQYGSSREAKGWNILEHVRVWRNRKPSTESTSLNQLLLHNSHHMLLLFCQQRNRSWLAVFADVLFPKKNTHTEAQTIRMPIKLDIILLPVQKSQKAQDTMRFKVEMCHFSQAFSKSDVVMECNARFMIATK